MRDQDVNDEMRWRRNRQSLKQLSDKMKRDLRRQAQEQVERWSREQSYPVREDFDRYRP